MKSKQTKWLRKMYTMWRKISIEWFDHFFWMKVYLMRSVRAYMHAQYSLWYSLHIKYGNMIHSALKEKNIYSTHITYPLKKYTRTHHKKCKWKKSVLFFLLHAWYIHSAKCAIEKIDMFFCFDFSGNFKLYWINDRTNQQIDVR